MHYLKLVFLTLSISLIVLGCGKEAMPDRCERLKSALATQDRESTKMLITAYIRRLPSKEYTEKNLKVLASLLSKQCSISTVEYCFDCIQTMPGESEIRLTFTSNQSNIVRAIDISYTPDNQMEFINVHE